MTLHYQEINPHIEPIEQDQYKVEIVLDSLHPNKRHRLTTFKIELWRPVLAEFNTHCMLSRNAPSSRAISVEKLIARIQKSPARPVVWGKRTGVGMQAGGVLTESEQKDAEDIWLDAMNINIKYAEKLMKLGVHQGIANRLVEPFMKTTVLASATEWANFIYLRNDTLAQPEMRVIGQQIYDLLRNNEPTLLKYWEWHLPFVTGKPEFDLFPIEDKIKISIGKCCRVSYYNFDGTHEPQKDIELADRIIESKHLSPAEHTARPLGLDENDNKVTKFKQFVQYRRFVAGENYETKIP